MDVATILYGLGIGGGLALVGRYGLQVLQPKAFAGRLYRVIPAPGEGSPDQLFNTLHGLLRGFWHRLQQGQPAVSLELVGTDHQAYFRIFIPDAVAGSVQRFLRAAYPGIRLEEETGEAGSAIQVRAVVSLDRPSVLPLQVEREIETLAPLLAVLSEPGEKESIELQIVAAPHPAGWQAAAKSEASRRRKGQHANFLSQAILDGEGHSAPSHFEVMTAQAIEAKSDGLPFECAIRLTIRAVSEARGKELLRDVMASLRPFSGANSFRHREPANQDRFDQEFAARVLPLFGRFILTTPELSGLWHMPEELPRHLLSSRSPALAPPHRLPAVGRLLGLSAHASTDVRIHQSLSDARLHTHIAGPTGSGKTELLLNLILQDLDAGRGVAVVDPKSDLVAAILSRYPRHRLDDLVYISPRSGKLAVGLNPLETAGRESERLIDNTVAAFEKSLSQWNRAPRTEEVLRSALLTLREWPNATLAHVPLLLGDATFRRRVLATIDDPIGIGSFWAWYQGLTDGQRGEVVSPLLNRLRAFLSLSAVRRLLCQPQSTIDLGTVIGRGQVLLVDLAPTAWGETTGRLVGSMIFVKLWHAAQERLGQPEAERSDFMVYVDEFSQLIALADSFSETLAQARALGLSLTLAHQHLGQLPDEVRQAVLSNARTRIVFQTGQDDARILAREMAPLEASHLMNLPRFTAAIRLALGGQTSETFTMTTQAARKPVEPGIAPEATARSLARYGRPVEEVDRELRQSIGYGEVEAPIHGVGRRRVT